jgi:hypothetical protein
MTSWWTSLSYAVGGQVGHAAAEHDPPGPELGGVLAVTLPGHERVSGRPVPDGREGVGGHHAGETFRVLADQAQADQAAPVLADPGDGVEADLLDDRPGPVDVGLVGAVVAVGGLVAAPEAHHVHRHRPQAGGDEDGDHLAVAVRAGRLAVQQQHDLAVTGSFVEVVDPQAAAIPGSTST